MKAITFCLKSFKFNNFIIKRAFASATQQTENEIILSQLIDADEGIVVLNLNDIKKKNSINANLVNNLNDKINNINKSNIKVLIIKSNVPGIFCVGADLKERLKMPEQEVSNFVSYLRSTINQLQHLPMPVIAALDGSALGGGLELALACDIRVAASNIKLGLVETRLAIIPGGGGSARLPRLINLAVAKELIYTAKVFNACEAKAMGIINHAIDQNDEGNAAYLKSLNIAREILPNGSVAVRMAKFAINKGIEVDINTALSIEQAAYQHIIPTKDRIEGLKAFIEKRSPHYIGE